MAIQVIREVSADVVKRGSTRAVYAKQDDFNSRFLNVLIQEDGKDIKVNPEAEVILNVERPDKLKNMFYGTINEDGSVKVPLTSWMLELEGTLSCDISIVKEGVAKLTTMQFNIYVEEAVVNDGSVVETEEYSVIVDLLKRTTESAQIASEAAKNAITLKTNCEKATTNANVAAADARNALNEVAAGGFIGAIKEQNSGANLKFWVGSRAEYDALPSKLVNCFYIITDDRDRAGQLDKLASFNKTLFEGSGATGNTINLDLGMHSLFVITVSMTLADISIVCGTTRTVLGWKVLEGTGTYTTTNGDTVYCRVSLLQNSETTATIQFAQWSESMDFSEAVSANVSKVVGIM